MVDGELGDMLGIQTCALTLRPSDSSAWAFGDRLR